MKAYFDQVGVHVKVVVASVRVYQSLFDMCHLDLLYMWLTPRFPLSFHRLQMHDHAATASEMRLHLHDAQARAGLGRMATSASFERVSCI